MWITGEGEKTEREGERVRECREKNEGGGVNQVR
jgi:hypothetical protein